MRKKIQAWWRAVWPMLVAAVLLAVGLTFLMEWRYFLNDFGATWDFVFGRPKVFLYNAWLMLLILGALGAVLNGFWRGAGLLGALVLVVSYINLNKMLVRGVPLLPEDLQLASEAGALASFVDAWSIVGLVLAVALWIGVITAAAIGWRKWMNKRAAKFGEGEYMEKPFLAMRVGTVVGLALVFMGSSAFVVHHAGTKTEQVKWLDTTFIAWNQSQNYQDNGFLLGFLYNWAKFGLAEPEGYSEEAMATVYEDLSEGVSDKSDNAERPGYNIVVVLEESFVDFSKMEDYYPHSGGDVTPNLRRIMSENPSGYMYSVDYGGGTANVEFEAITGLTNYWMQTVPYTNLVPRQERVPSYATWAKENGYATVAVHAYGGGMYKRNIALPREGFDEFIAMSDYTHVEKENGSEYINDRSTYAEILDVLKRDEKQFVLAITMQNHTPFNGESGDFVLTEVPSGDAGRKRELESYLESLHRSDKYLGEFIAALEEFDEKTVVILFGDHAPGLLWELDNSSDAEEVKASRTTPYFVYANFDLSEGVSDKSEWAEKVLPTTTPNCILNTAFNTLGITNKPMVGKLLDEVCMEEPILTPRYVGSRRVEGEALQRYQWLTYDLLK